MHTSSRRLVPPAPARAIRPAGIAWAAFAWALGWAGLVMGLNRSGALPEWVHLAAGTVALAYALGAGAVAAGDLLPGWCPPAGRLVRVALVAVAPAVATLLVAVLFALYYDPHITP